MKYLKGIDGSLSCDGRRLAKVASWSFNSTVGALETTTLADHAKTYASGVQNHSGACTVYCYEDAAGELEAAALTGSILRTDATPHSKTYRLSLSLNGQMRNRTIDCDAVITSVSLGVSTGGVVMADIGFVVTGSLHEAGMGVS